jgi:hypothetical protein
MRRLAHVLIPAALAAAGCSQNGNNGYYTASHPAFNSSASTGTGGGTTTSGSTASTSAGSTSGGASSTGGYGTSTGGGLPDSGPPAGIDFIGTNNPFLGVDYHASYSVNTINTFTFRVIDSADGGVPDAAVFITAQTSTAIGSNLLYPPPAGGIVPSDAGITVFTDDFGDVSAQIQSGTGHGQVFMYASVQLPTGNYASAQGSSYVVGTQASRANSGISCTPVNLPVYSGHNPVCATKSDYSGTVTCTVKLGDRFNNAVAIAVPVSFYTEAGLWQSQTVNTPAYGQGNTTTPYGWAVNTLNTAQGGLPQDVDPIAGEPSNSGLCAGTVPRVYNPRDGLVTVMAAFTGEEAFVAESAQSYWVPGDPFFDLPQPFVDTDDSSVWKPGEFCAGSTTDGGCDGPNHQWDGNTNIWVENWIVYTGDPVTTVWSDLVAPTIYSLPSTGTVTWADVNINTPASGLLFGTQCSVYSPTSGEPTGFSSTYPWPTTSAPTPPDGLGMTVTQLPMCDAGMIDIDGGMAANTLCWYQTVVYGFDQGFTAGYAVSESTSQYDAGSPYCIYSSAALPGDALDQSQLCGTAYGP